MGDDKEIKGQEEGPAEDETQGRRTMMTMPGSSQGWGKGGSRDKPQRRKRSRPQSEMVRGTCDWLGRKTTGPPARQSAESSLSRYISYFYSLGRKVWCCSH